MQSSVPLHSALLQRGYTTITGKMKRKVLAESFVRGVPSQKTYFFVFVFLVDEGRTEDPYNTKGESSSAHQRDAIKMAFRWRADDSMTMNLAWLLCYFPGDPDQY